MTANYVPHLPFELLHLVLQLAEVLVLVISDAVDVGHDIFVVGAHGALELAHWTVAAIPSDLTMVAVAAAGTGFEVLHVFDPCAQYSNLIYYGRQ